jgi:hypothetical protein
MGCGIIYIVKKIQGFIIMYIQTSKLGLQNNYVLRSKHFFENPNSYSYLVDASWRNFQRKKCFLSHTDGLNVLYLLSHRITHPPVKLG